MKLFITVCLSILGLFSTQQAAAQMAVGGRHVYIMYPGVDSLWGSYIFTVVNPSPSPQRFSFPVMLPKETIDFQAQDTLSKDEITLGSDGGVTINKEFGPGETMIQLGFKIPGEMGEAKASFKAPYNFDSLGVFVWQNSIGVSGQDMTIHRGIDLNDRLYDAYSYTTGKSGQSYDVLFTGLPEGRSRLWLIGWGFAALLLIAAIALAYTSRPHISQVEDNF